MGYDTDLLCVDCYEGTACLINKFNIRDISQLALIEAEITFAKASALEQNPMAGQFDFAHYKAIHKYLFSDLYGWAGEIRTVDMSKKGTVFVPAAQIESVADACFARLKENHGFADYSYTDFINEIVDFYCVTNMLHPFREGNGRAQRAFISQLVRHAGYSIDFSKICSDELLIATIQSANGVTDYLKALFEEMITK